MDQTDSKTSNQPQEAKAQPQPVILPELQTSLSPDEIIARLDKASRRGKLAGFIARTSRGLFEADAFAEGAQFDRSLIAVAKSDSGSTQLVFSTKAKPTLPTVFAVVIVLTIWPGEPITHSMLVTYFSWYQIQTWWWYLPLCLPLPFTYRKMLKRSHTAAASHALETISKLEKLLDANTVTQTDD